MVQMLTREAPAGRPPRTKRAIIDCDVHCEPNDDAEVHRFLPPRWQEHLATYGSYRFSGAGYPRYQNRRQDSFPPSGRKSGSDVEFLCKQLLDEHNIVWAVLTPLTGVGGHLNLELDAALASAWNDWLIADWLDKDPRFVSSLFIPFEDAEASVAEIERRASEKRFVQVQFSGRPREPMGRKKYWPIYAACEEHGLAVMSHAFGSGGQPITGAGFPSFYIEDHVGPAQSMQANIISLVAEGVFERFPGLRLVSAENGFGWLPSLMWRMDNSWQLMKSEAPQLKHEPSHYIREHIYLCTQPVEEPHKPEYFGQMLDYLGGGDRIVFASDYPHWDWDDPDHVLPPRLPDAVQQAIFYDNAARCYDLPAAPARDPA
jgi:predicted TIM-barrel fold metal-dependent hydrolase